MSAAEPNRRTRFEPYSREWWVRCDAGHEHYGEYGAAGLLVKALMGPDRRADMYLLQRRPKWVDHPGLHGIPGGALRKDEQPMVGALREAMEEGVRDLRPIGPYRVLTSDHGGWAFHTVLALVTVPPTTKVTREADGYDWMTKTEIVSTGLHPGLRAFLDEHYDDI